MKDSVKESIKKKNIKKNKQLAYLIINGPKWDALKKLSFCAMSDNFSCFPGWRLLFTPQLFRFNPHEDPFLSQAVGTLMFNLRAVSIIFLSFVRIHALFLRARIK